MKHSSHEHALILNETYIARDGDACRGCSEQIFSCKSFVYSCSRITATSTSTDTSVDNNSSCASFLLHKKCAELPLCIRNPVDRKELLFLYFDYSYDEFLRFRKISSADMYCKICDIQIPWDPKQFFYCGTNSSYGCLSCVIFKTQQALKVPEFKHPAHDQHFLFLIQDLSSFRCYACNIDDNIKDMSYKCTTCQFWIHKNCAQAPTTFHFQFHDKHPLFLSFSLPQEYHKFGQHCGLCNKKLSRLVWLYYCRNCKFFVHFRCARSFKGILNSSGNEKHDSDLVQLPAADESSLNLLSQEFIKATCIQNKKDDGVFNTINGIKHWTHEQHHLQLINSNEFKNQQDVDNPADKLLLLCDGCVRSIDEEQFYGCVVCKYYLHKFCAELPKQINLNFVKGLYATASEHNKPYELFYCRGCGLFCNGIFLKCGPSKFHIGCLTLPEWIKHEAHRHKLKHKFNLLPKVCKACMGVIIYENSHNCEQCDYHICTTCIMKTRVVNHPWDRHPLGLIYEPSMVMNHEHDFSCEFCSKDINPNYWFYHCSDCDLSFHLFGCLEKSSYRRYSNVKFGATDIVLDKLHPHSLTLVLNKKFRRCKNCHQNQLGEPVLECVAPCKVIFCRSCIEVVTEKKSVQRNSVATYLSTYQAKNRRG